MDKKKAVFIVNPVSGTARKKRVVSHIEQHVDADRLAAEIRYTEHAGHATALAAEAVGEGADIVVAVGGDGTINEVGRALVGSQTALGIIPCGSGNGLARHLHLPLRPSHAIGIINQLVVHRLDYGLCNGLPFFCTCGVGFDAHISAKFAAKKRRGPVAYAKCIIEEGLRYKPEPYTISCPELEEQRKAVVVSCCNASQYGNNAFIAPHASMKDGLLDVTLIEPFGVKGTPGIVIGMFNRRLTDNHRVISFRTSKLTIERESDGPFHCDGDAHDGGRRIEVGIVPKAINVVVNPETHVRHSGINQLLRSALGR